MAWAKYSFFQCFLDRRFLVWFGPVTHLDPRRLPGLVPAEASRGASCKMFSKPHGGPS